MLNFLITHIKLSIRIFLGYFIVAALTLVLIVFVFFTFRNLSSEFRSYIAFSKNTSNINTFISLMNKMKRQTLIYTYEGYESASKQVMDNYSAMQKHLGEQRSNGDESIRAIFKVTEKHLNSYYATFLEVKKQREIQKHLVYNELQNQANEAQKLIDALIQKTDSQAKLKKAMGKSNSYYRLLTSLLLIEKNAHRYFDTLDSIFIDKASKSFNATQKSIQMIRLKRRHNAQKINEIEKVINLYRKIFFEAVQRTRGYLYLVNVVMAAEAYEVIYQTQKLSDYIKANELRIESAYDEYINKALQNLVIVSVILFVIIILFSLLISKSIAIPLDRLTNTFKSLSSGSSDASIPLYHLDDEIGALTLAANSFKQKNYELEQSKIELERSNDELEQFVYTVSHDLKSPIVTSMGFISIIQKLSSQGKYEQAMAKMDKVVKSNERMSQLINDLLELSRVGRIDMDKKMLDLNVLLKNFSADQAERLKNNSFNLQINYPLPTIYANESRTLQIFENILSNALKYTKDVSDPELTIGVAETTNSWKIYCKDNGPGIQKDYHEKVFALFYRLDQNIEGTGVGLAVAKKIMKFHNGNIWVESEPPNGSTFWIEFPKITN